MTLFPVIFQNVITTPSANCLQSWWQVILLILSCITNIHPLRLDLIFGGGLEKEG